MSHLQQLQHILDAAPTQGPAFHQALMETYPHCDGTNDALGQAMLDLLVFDRDQDIDVLVGRQTGPFCFQKAFDYACYKANLNAMKKLFPYSGASLAHSQALTSVVYSQSLEAVQWTVDHVPATGWRDALHEAEDEWVRDVGGGRFGSQDALNEAVVRPNLDIVSALLPIYGADQVFAAIEHAVIYLTDQDMVSVLKLLLPKIPTDGVSGEKLGDLLGHVVNRDHPMTNTMQCILKHWDNHVPNDEPLHIAAQRGQAGALRLMLNAIPFEPDVSSFLQSAVFHEHTHVIDVLLDWASEKDVAMALAEYAGDGWGANVERGRQYLSSQWSHRQLSDEVGMAGLARMRKKI